MKIGQIALMGVSCCSFVCRASDVWLVDPHATWFLVATAPMIVHGNISVDTNSATGCRLDETVVLKGDCVPRCVFLSSLGTEVRDQLSGSDDLEGGEVVAFLDYSYGCEAVLPASPETVCAVAEEIKLQKNKERIFSKAVANIAVPHENSVSNLIGQLVAGKQMDESVSDIARLGWNAVPALIKQMTNEAVCQTVFGESLPLSFPNRSETAMERNRHYLSDSLEGTLSILSDCLLGFGIASAYRDSNPEERKFLASMWKNILMIWIEKGMNNGEFLRPVLACPR